MPKHVKRTVLPVVGSIVLMMTLPSFVDAQSTTGTNSTADNTTGVTSTSPTLAFSWIPLNVSVPQNGATDGAMVFNPNAHNAVMFGGLSSSTSYSPDVWTGGNWSTVRLGVTASSPSNSGSYTGAYDPLTRQVVLFGGGTADGNEDYGTSNSTLIWQWNRWSPVHPSLSPSSRDGAVMSYDAATKQVLLFGGAQKAANGWQDLNDTWVWNGSTWTQLKPKTSPPVRRFAGMTYDAKIGKVVLFGGEYGNGIPSVLNDMWTWDGTTWTKVNEPNPPAARADASFVYDGKLGDIVLFGGRTLSQSGTLAPSNDTWLWDGTTWTEDHPVVSPPARYGAAATYDEDTGRVVMYGGFSDQSTTPNIGDHTTWVFDLPYSPSPTNNAISVTADPSFPPSGDGIVKVNGLENGDVVKVYSATNFPLAQSTVKSVGRTSTNDVTASVYVPNLNGPSTLSVTVTQPGFGESLPVGVQVPQLRTYAPSIIKVVNNVAGTPDQVTVTGQASGDILKVYADSQGKKLLGKATADSNGNAVISVPQLGIGAGTIYVSAIRADLAESQFTKLNYPAEVTPTPAANHMIGTMADSAHKSDVVQLKGLQTGDVVKIYAGLNGGKPVAQGTELTSKGVHTGRAKVVIPQSAVRKTMYFSVTDPHRTESARTAFTVKP